MTSQVAQWEENLPAAQETQETQIPDPWVRKTPWRRGMATHSRIVWRTPWTEQSDVATVHRVAKSWKQQATGRAQCYQWHFIFLLFHPQCVKCASSQVQKKKNTHTERGLLNLQDSHLQEAKNGEKGFPYVTHSTCQGEESFLDAPAGFPCHLIAQV